ncbi:MAG: UDP-galactose 4-epimerase [Microgenomates group bacterium GW2011_GWA2_46_16]|nr:MAG: UDP-galactose 4-epimerase [Microgenomates group bacterium GW2011_GWA2_46_16]
MILVTGGCGYIGSHLVNTLAEYGYQVVVFDNLLSGKESALLHHEPLVVGDITNPQDLTSVFSQYQVDTVIHLAALVNAAESVVQSDRYQQVNNQGSKNVWQAAMSRGVKTYLYASSAAVYGTPPTRGAIKETSPLLPTSPYGVNKLAGERSLAAITGNDHQAGIFRFFNVAGAKTEGRLGQSKASRAIMQRLFAVAHGEIPSLKLSGHDYDTQDGTVLRDFVHVEDVVRAMLLGVKHLQNGGVAFTLNLGGGHSTSMKELHTIVEEVTGITIPLTYAKRIPGDIVYSLADIALAQTTLDWEPAYNVRQMVADGWNAYVKRN